MVSVEIIRDYNLKMYSHGCRHTGDRGEEREGGVNYSLLITYIRLYTVARSRRTRTPPPTTHHAGLYSLKRTKQPSLREAPLPLIRSRNGGLKRGKGVKGNPYPQVFRFHSCQRVYMQKDEFEHDKQKHL